MPIARSAHDGARAPVPRYSPTWLELREGADAAARATDLPEVLRHRFADRGDARIVVRDLGCGTGSMGRWLAPRLPGAQHWILQDRDPELLDTAAATVAVGNPSVTTEPRLGDLTTLTAADLTGTALVTASALLDLLSRDEIDALADACVTAGTAALLTLSVTGRVELDPADPLDADLAAAFDDHLRHHVDGRHLLGPDAADAAAAAFTRRGATVLRRPSPWRLGAAHGDLAAAWLRGFVPAAVARRPRLADRADAYLDRRLSLAATGDLRVTVHHADLLALPDEVAA